MICELCKSQVNCKRSSLIDGECNQLKPFKHEVYHFDMIHPYSKKIVTMEVEAYEYYTNGRITNVFNILQDGFIRNSSTGKEISKKEAEILVKRWFRYEATDFKFNKLICLLDTMDEVERNIFFAENRNNLSLRKLLSFKDNIYFKQL